MNEHIYLLTISLPLATVLLVFAMRYGSAVLQARAKGRGDASRQEIQDSLDEIKARLGGIEKILKAVE
jgi:hypothetical protein